MAMRGFVRINKDFEWKKVPLALQYIASQRIIKEGKDGNETR
jgi:hypothetical protein